MKKYRQFRRYQFVVWFPRWVGLKFVRLDPDKTFMAYVFDWYLVLGFWEIRRWTDRKLPDAQP